MKAVNRLRLYGRMRYVSTRVQGAVRECLKTPSTVAEVAKVAGCSILHARFALRVAKAKVVGTRPRVAGEGPGRPHQLWGLP